MDDISKKRNFIYDVNDFVVSSIAKTKDIPSTNSKISIRLIKLTPYGEARLRGWLEYPSTYGCPFSITCGVCEKIFTYYLNELHKECPCMIYGFNICEEAGKIILKRNDSYLKKAKIIFKRNYEYLKRKFEKLF